MERVGSLFAVLDNNTELLHNIISQMCRPCRTYHARRRRCVGVLTMSENQHKKRRTSDVEAAKTLDAICSGLRSVLHIRIGQNTQKCRKIYPVIGSI